jgi:hypothetical protein
MSSEIINYIDSFIDEKYVFFYQKASDIYSVLVEDNVSYSDKDLNIKQEEYKEKIIEYLNIIKYNKRDVIILINGLDNIYNECLKRSNLLINKLNSLYSEQKITNDNKDDVKLKMLDAIKYEMKKHIGIILEGERKMLRNALIKKPQLSQLSQRQPQQLSQLSQSSQQPPRSRQWPPPPPPPPPREELPLTPQTQQSSQSSQSQEQPPSNPQQSRPSQSPLLLQRPREKQGQQQQQQLAPRLLPIPPVQQQLQQQLQQYQQQQQQQQQQQRQQPAPRLLQRPPDQQQLQQQLKQQLQQQQLQQQQLQQQQLQQQQTQQMQQMQQTRQLQQKHNGEDMANLLKTHFYKTKYNKIKDGNEQVIKYNISTVPHIKYTDDNDVIIDMIKGNTQIKLETTNKYVYNFKEKKIINGIQDIGIFLKESNLKSIKYFLKPRKSGSPYLEITINIPYIILSDDDTHIYLTNTDISSSGTDIDLENYILSLIDIINNYVRKQDPISFL